MTLPREKVQSYPRPPRWNLLRSALSFGWAALWWPIQSAPCGCWKPTTRPAITCRPKIFMPPCAPPQAAAFANGKAGRAITM